MIRLDSTKIKLPFEVIHEISKSSFIDKKTTKEGVVISDKAVLNNPIMGVKQIEIDNQRKEAVFEFSAKVLKEQYYDLLNIHTIERCFDTINSIGAVRLNVNDAIGKAEVLRCDVTKNLVMHGDVKEYIDTLNHLRVNNRYTVDQYKQKTNNGIVFNGKQTSFKERMIFYDKTLDLLKDKKMQQAVPMNKLLSQFKNVLRCEANIVQLRKIRELCGGSTNLLKLLNSNTNPNLFLFDKIKSKSINLELFSKYEGMKFSQLEKLIGQKEIIKQLHYDMNLINQFIDSRVGGNTSRYKKHYRSICTEMHSDNSRQKSNELLVEIEQQLKVA
jgi:hypothetical protein